MKIQLETIPRSLNSSFNLIVNPNLSDLFYWHFHPEYELVYIENASASRHVGDHISTFEHSDLVLIGSNMPHLNFDYGVTTNYQKMVVHIKPNFIQEHISHTPELKGIARLFDQSRHGIAFSGATKRQVGAKMLQLPNLDPFDLYLELIQIFQQLASSTEKTLLHEHPYKNQYSRKEQDRLRKIYAFIDRHYQEKIELQQVAQLSNLSKEAFCRYFKKVTGNTFIDFLNQYRISQSKRMLMSGKSVGEACYHSGFESLSYFNRVFKKLTGENPSGFRKRYIA